MGVPEGCGVPKSIIKKKTREKNIFWVVPDTFGPFLGSLWDHFDTISDKFVPFRALLFRIFYGHFLEFFGDVSVVIMQN